MVLIIYLLESRKFCSQCMITRLHDMLIALNFYDKFFNIINKLKIFNNICFFFVKKILMRF
jgi:hypothetical protein